MLTFKCHQYMIAIAILLVFIVGEVALGFGLSVTYSIYHYALKKAAKVALSKQNKAMQDKFKSLSDSEIGTIAICAMLGFFAVFCLIFSPTLAFALPMWSLVLTLVFAMVFFIRLNRFYL